MLFVAVVAVSALVVLFRRGDLKGLSELRIRYAGVVVAAFAMQAAMEFAAGRGYLPARDRAVAWGFAAWHLASYLLLLWALAVNVRVRGLPLVLSGVFLNFVAIAANGMRMPVSGRALELFSRAGAAEYLAAGVSPSHVLATDATRLPWFGDLLPVPIPPFTSVISVGDVLIAAGLFYLVQKAAAVPRREDMGSPSGARREKV